MSGRSFDCTGAYSLSEIQIFCNNILEYLFSAIITELSFKSDQIMEHSSMVEYSTADREVLGSNPCAPFEIIYRNSKITKIFSLYLAADYNGQTVNL